jgi:hypothetical protein
MRWRNCDVGRDEVLVARHAVVHLGARLDWSVRAFAEPAFHHGAGGFHGVQSLTKSLIADGHYAPSIAPARPSCGALRMGAAFARSSTPGAYRGAPVCDLVGNWPAKGSRVTKKSRTPRFACGRR